MEPTTSNPSVSSSINHEMVSTFHPKYPDLVQLKSDKLKIDVFRVKDLNIFAAKPEDCQLVYELYKSMGQRGEFGSLMQNQMKKLLSPDFLKFVIFGIPGKEIPGLPARAIYVNGNNAKIILPLDYSVTNLRLNLGHEAVHFFFDSLTHSTDPFFSLPKEVSNKFIEIFRKEEIRFEKNPFKVGSRDWNIHNFLKKWIFGSYKYYKTESQLLEIAAFTLQTELAFEGGILRKFSPVLADTFHEILSLHHQPLPKGFQSKNNPFFLSQFQESQLIQDLKQQKLFPSLSSPHTFSENIQMISLEDLNKKTLSTPLNGLMKCVGNASLKSLNTLLKGGIKTLQFGSDVLNHPISSIIFAYEKGQENALIKAVANGTSVWSLNVRFYKTLSIALGNVPTLVIGLGSLAAEIVPDLHEIEKNLPSEQELESIGTYSPELETLLRGDAVAEYRNFLKCAGHLQHGLKAINLARLWDKYAKDFVNSSIDKVVDSYKTRRLTKEFENLIVSSHDHTQSNEFLRNLEKVEEALSMEFEEYLKKYPYSNTNPLPLSNNNNQSFGTSTIICPNLDTLEGITTPSNPNAVNLDHLRDCDLDWSLNQNPDTGIISLQTSVTLSPDEVEAIPNLPIFEENVVEETISTENRSVSIHNSGPINSPTIEKPAFIELCKIKEVDFGEGIGGGHGLVFSLASGAKFSVSTDGKGVFAGVLAPLTKDCVSALGTGLVFTIPIAAALVGIGLLLQNKEKKIQSQLKKNANNTIKDLEKINKGLENFFLFFEHFNNGKIDKDAFLQTVNELSEKLHLVAHKARKRGEYEEKKNKSPQAGFLYFFERTRLKQIDLDLKRLMEEGTIRREVQEQVIPQIKNRSVKEIVDTLKTFSNKKLLTIREKYEQEVLYKELLEKSSMGNLDLISEIDPLLDISFGINLNPPGVAKPHHLKPSKFVNKDDSDKRQSKRTKEWASVLERTYQKFQEACKSGNLEEMERSSQAVLHEISRTDGNHDINLKRYPIYVKDSAGKEYINAAQYYENYIDTIKKNTEQTMEKARAVANGNITSENPAIFTPDEIKAWKIQQATTAFNNAVEIFNTENTSMENRNEAFTCMFEAAKILDAFGKQESNIQKILKIGNQYSLYSDYEKALNRLEKIQDGIFKLREITEKMKNSQIKSDEQASLFKQAKEKAEELQTQQVSQEDIQKIIEADEEKINTQVLEVTEGENPEKIKEEVCEDLLQVQTKNILDWINSIPQEYSVYQAKLDRLKTILSGISNLQDTSKKMEKEGIKRKEYAELYKSLYDQALKLFLEQGLTEEDLNNFAVQSSEDFPEEKKSSTDESTKNVKDNSRKIMDWILSIREGYPNFVKMEHYENYTLPLVSSPLAKGILFILSDTMRYENKPLWSFGVKAISTGNSFAPEFIPRAVNCLIANALEKNAVVTDALARKCFSSLSSNVFTSIKELAPKNFVQQTFSKKVNTLQRTSASIYVISTVVNEVSSHLFKGNPKAEKLTQTINGISLVTTKATTALQYTNLTRKTVKYLKAGTLIQKMDKLGEGIVGLAMTGFDLFEFLATDSSEFESGKEWIETIQGFLPTFRGNLPENSLYYAGKDITITLAYAMIAAYKRNPLLIGLASYQAFSTVYSGYYTKYTDYALASILANLRWFAKQTETTELKNSEESSMNNLLYYIDNNFIFLPSDSKMKKKAKQFAFEHHVSELEKKEKWDEVYSETIIDKDALNCLKFRKTKMDIFESISVVIKHYNAFLRIMDQKEHLLKMSQDLYEFLYELDTIKNYIQTSWDNLPNASKDKSMLYMQSFINCLDELKTKILTNLCISYVKEQFTITPMVALYLFDQIPCKERNISHWYTLGTIATKLLEDKKSPNLMELQIFCFETILELINNKEKENTELSKFEVELKKISTKIMDSLKDFIRLQNPYSMETPSFTPFVEKFLSEQNGKQEIDIK